MDVTKIMPVIESVSMREAIKENPNEKNVNFKDMLMDAFTEVSGLERESDKITSDFIAGKTDEIHSVLIAAEKASISLDLIVEIRNKVIEAYNEIMRMQV